MLDATREALESARGKTEYDIGEDRMLVLGLVKEIEIIGEAAGKVSESTRRQLSQTPWQDVVDTRNRLIHAYFDIDVGVVWDTVTKDLRPLIAALENALAPEPYRASPKQVDISCCLPLTPTLSPKGRGNSSFSERQARYERISSRLYARSSSPRRHDPLPSPEFSQVLRPGRAERDGEAP